MVFTEELKRRLNMKAKDVAQEMDNFFIDTQKELVAKVEKVFFKYFKGLSPEKINYEACQTVGWFQEYMEYGGFCLPGEGVKITETHRALLHIGRVERRDLLAAVKTFQKALNTVKRITRDPGAWEEFQRRLAECVILNGAKRSRRDLLVLQTLSGLEMISETTKFMLKDGTLFDRNKWLFQKTRRVIIDRLAFLFEWSKRPNQNPSTVPALQHILRTMTKNGDWGDGKNTFGNTFVQFAKDVFEALGMTDLSEDGALSGTTIRKDILASIEEFEIVNRKTHYKNM